MRPKTHSSRCVSICCCPPRYCRNYHHQRFAHAHTHTYADHIRSVLCAVYVTVSCGFVCVACVCVCACASKLFVVVVRMVVVVVCGFVSKGIFFSHTHYIVLFLSVSGGL